MGRSRVARRTNQDLLENEEGPGETPQKQITRVEGYKTGEKKTTFRAGIWAEHLLSYNEKGFPPTRS